jgi:hypothetical protein
MSNVISMIKQGRCISCGGDTEPIVDYNVIDHDECPIAYAETIVLGHEPFCPGCDDHLDMEQKHKYYEDDDTQDMLQQRAADLECLESHEEYTDDNLPF